MPPYFESLNTEYRYQATPLAKAAPNLHIKAELSGGRFTIGGAGPGQKVCWQVTGIRSDAWASANPLIVEPEKEPAQRGLYWNPAAFGKPESKWVFWRDPKQAPEAPAIEGTP